jgi:DNA-binding response OmpR family regulator
VEKLGGQIGFETQTNVGTTFYFDLPEWHEAVISKITTSHSPESLPILICEDDPDIATLLSLMLKQEGLSADIAYNAAQAKQLLSENCYAAMTVDLALPGQDGISLIRELREDENTQSLPIVVVSAKAQQGREQLSGGGLPVIDWLDKPIDQARLMASVRQAVRQNSDSKPHILYVEDDPDLTQVVSTILQNIAEIDSAKNLHEARHKLSSKTFDLVILDLSLPDGSGLELLADLNNQIFSSIPAVIFSANTVGMEAAHHVAAALVKSRTSNQQLLETIKSLIGRGNSAS